MFIPPHFVRRSGSLPDRRIFDAELDFSIAENRRSGSTFVRTAPVNEGGSGGLEGRALRGPVGGAASD